MEKLELRHLAGYLEHGLKVIWVHNNIIFTMDADGCLQNTLTISDILDEQLHEETCLKPLVIPLSQLTDIKWIEVFKAGINEFKDIESDYYVQRHKRFVVIEYVQWSTRIKVTYDIKNQQFNISGHPNFNQLAAFTKLYSLHADLHGLVEKGIGLNKLDYEK